MLGAAPAPRGEVERATLELPDGTLRYTAALPIAGHPGDPPVSVDVPHLQLGPYVQPLRDALPWTRSHLEGR